MNRNTKLPLPSQKQAHAYFLHAVGMDVREIAQELGLVPQQVQALLNVAIKRAEAFGLKIMLEKPKEVVAA
jgi:predicted transcriptional regulator